MSDDPTQRRMKSLKAFKSKLIMRADSYSRQGLHHLAQPFNIEAAEQEQELAALFEAAGRHRDANISLLSAASCLVEAGQFRSAIPILARLAPGIPEAAEMLAECRGRPNQPLAADPRALQALVLLLKKKGYINDTDWQQALDEVLAGAGAGPRPPA